MKRFRITSVLKYKANGFGFMIELISPCLKEKYPPNGHWRVEIPERLLLHFFIWEMTIYFGTEYWEDWCDKKNEGI